MCVGSNSEQLFCCLDSIARNSFFVTIANACVSVIILQIFDYEFLPNVNNFVDSFVGQVY